MPWSLNYTIDVSHMEARGPVFCVPVSVVARRLRGGGAGGGIRTSQVRQGPLAEGVSLEEGAAMILMAGQWVLGRGI